MVCTSASACGGPEPVVTGQYRLGDVRHVVASAERARDELGFAAAVAFDDGVAEFLDLARVKQNTLGNTRMLKRLTS